MELFARVGVKLIPLGPSTRSIAAGLKAPSPDAAFRLAAELVAARFETLPAAAEDCDALVATGLMPAGARDIAEQLGIRYVLACLHIFGLPSRPLPAGRAAGQAVGRGRDRQPGAVGPGRGARQRAVRRAAQPGPRGDRPAAGRRRPRPRPRRPGLAGRGSGPRPVEGADRPRHRPDGVLDPAGQRPLSNELEAFLDAGEPPVYVGFGSMAMRTSTDLGRVTVEATRAHGRRAVLGPRLGGPGADRRGARLPGRRRGQPANAVPRGSPPSCTTAAPARRRPPPWPAPPRSWCPRSSTSRTGRGGWLELGVGAAHDGPVPTSESLASALATALAPETRARATAVAGDVRTDGARVAARRLVER